MEENKDKNMDDLDELKTKFEKNPDNLDLNKRLADKYLELNRPQDALVHIKKCVELDPNYAQGYNQLGVCYLTQNKLEEAEKSFIDALKLDFNLIDAHFNLASLYQKVGKYKKALSYFKEVVVKNPQDYVAYHRMGECSLAASMNSEALEFLKEAIRLKPDFLEAATDLATLYIKQGQLSDAENTLNNILKYYPKVAALHFSLALLLQEQKRYLEAIKHFREVVIIDENNAEAFNYLGECCVAADMKEQAEPFFAKAIKLQPDYYQAVFNLGNLYWEQERKDEAIMTLEQCLTVLDEIAERKEKWGEKIDEEIYTPVYNLLGKIYMQESKKDKAKEMWEKSLELNPEQPEIKKALEEIPKPLHKKVSLTLD